MLGSKDQFLVIFVPLESPVSQLSNEVKHVKNGALDLKIWLVVRKIMENVFKPPLSPCRQSEVRTYAAFKVKND